MNVKLWSFGKIVFVLWLLINNIIERLCYFQQYFRQHIEFVFSNRLKAVNSLLLLSQQQRRKQKNNEGIRFVLLLLLLATTKTINNIYIIVHHC